jgi:hypothetical protein
MEGCRGGAEFKGLQARSRTPTRAGFEIRGPRPQSVAMPRRDDAVAVGARDGACRAPQRPEFDAVDIQPAPRLFLCARCFSQVALCRHCDRGQRYCGQACSAAARRERQKEAGQRYQRGARGRAMHAERARRWRREGRRTAGVGISVTHQGQPEAVEALEAGVPIGTVTIGDPIAMAPRPAGQCCAQCARTLGPFVRLGYLRHRPHIRTRPRGESARPGGP